LTAHSPGFEADRLATLVARAFGRRAADLEAGPLLLETTDGQRLELGAFARSPGGA
jgi:hypothetical protein